jgi:hypothetical protein
MKQRFPNVKLIENKDNSVFRKGIIQVSLSPKENTFASSILIPWLPKILYKSTGFRRKAKDLGIVGVKLIDGAGFFLKVKESSTPLLLYKMTGFTSYFKSKYW